jgi:hypothetical protein
MIEEAMLRHPSSGQLQEIIAGNATRAFNSGVKHEHDRIVKIINQYSGKPDFTMANLLYLISKESRSE